MKYKNVITYLLLLLIGGLIGYFIKTVPHDHEGESELQKMDEEGTWTCAMHPEIRQNEPGICPICNMDLTLLEESSEEIDSSLIQLSEYAATLAEVETSIVGYGDSEGRSIDLQGKVEIDERKIHQIPAQFQGRIERLYVNFTGEKVRAGQLLASVYSPDLIAAQEELLQSIKYKEQNPAMYRAVRNKLKYWKISEGEIDRIEQSGEILREINIHTPASGVVLERKVTQGDHVQMGDILFEIADLSTLWVLFDAYEKDLQWIKNNSRLKFTVASLPGETFHSRVSFIDPIINPETRVAKVRAVVNNASGRLKPEMFVMGFLQVVPSGEELLVPKSAVLWTGKKSLVYVKESGYEKPTYAYRQISTAGESGDYYIVKDGLAAGEEVVSKAAFTIDAAAQLNGKASMMNSK